MSKRTPEYQKVYDDELKRLHQYWSTIPEEKLQYWAEKVADKRCNIQ